MAKLDSASGSDGKPDYRTVFIDTSLDTHLITVVSSSETVSDLKKKVLYEHALCFPHIGDIKIHGLKVKRRGKFYYLSESMLVKSVFDGVNKSWFITVDASSLEERKGNTNLVNPCSNNLLAPVGTMNNALVNPALPESHSNPKFLTNVDNNQLQKQIDCCDEHLGLDIAGGDGSRNMKLGIKLVEDTHGEAKLPDANDESGPSMHDKGDHYEKEKEIQSTPEIGTKSGSRGGICDKPGSMLSEERTAKITKNKNRKRKRNGDHDSASKKRAEVPESGMHRSQNEAEAPDTSLGNANGVGSYNDYVIDGPSTNSCPEANKSSGILQRLTIQNERPEKHVELSIAESRENRVDVLQDQSLEDNPQSEPAAKSRRKVKQARKGDEDLPKDNGTLVSESNKVMLEHSTISKKSLVDKQHTGNASLDDSSISRPSSLGIGTRNKEDDNVEGGHEASGAAIASKIKRKSVLKDNREDSLQGEVQASDTKEKKKEISSCGHEIHNDYHNHFSSQNGVNEHQNHVSGQNDTVDGEKEFSQKFSPKIASSEKYKISVLGEIQLKTKEVIVGSKLLEGSEAVDPPKSSKKRKKSKKTMDLVSVRPTSVTEHVKGIISGTSPIESHKVANGDHPSDTLNKVESHRLPEAGKEMDTMSTSFLATDKEIHDVIQNVVESVQQIGKDQGGTESIHGKSRKSSRKKQSSDAKLLPRSTKQSENIGKNNAGDMEYSSEVSKQATVANTGSTSHLIGSLLECGDVTAAENDQGTAQVQADKLKSNSQKRHSEAVIRSGHANDFTDDVEVSYESNRIEFNHYFAPKKHDLETVGSGEMLVDEATKTNGTHGTVKSKKKKKTKKMKHDADSGGPSSDFKTPQLLNNNQVVGATLHTGDSSSAEVQVSFTKSNSENLTVQPNKEPSKVSDSWPKALISSKSNKLISVPEEARQSNDAKPIGTVNGSKSKKAESNLESSNNSSIPRTRVNGSQSLDDHNHKVSRKASTIKHGEVVNSSKRERILVGTSGSIFKDDSDEACSSEDNVSDASTRTPSDVSLSSDYSDGESNADYNSSQNGSSSWKKDEGGKKTMTKPIFSGMTLDEILRSSTSYKKAKLTASLSQLEDEESQPVDFVPGSQA